MRAVEDRSAGDIDIPPSARIQPCYKRAPLAFQARIPYQAAIKPAKRSTPTMAPTSDSSVARSIAAHPIGGSLILGYDPAVSVRGWAAAGAMAVLGSVLAVQA